MKTQAEKLKSFFKSCGGWWLVVFPVLAEGALGEGVPFKTLFFQGFNFLLFFVILILISVKPLRAFFRQNREDFLNYRRQAQTLITQKEQEWKSLKSQVLQLEEKEKHLLQDVESARLRLKSQMTSSHQQFEITFRRQKQEEIKQEETACFNELKEKLLKSIVYQAHKDLQAQQKKSPSFLFHKDMIHQLKDMK